MNSYSNLPTAEEYRRYLEVKDIYIFEYSRPKYQCPECDNGGMCRNEKIVYTSYPPRYEYKCNKCGYVEYNNG